MEKGIRFEKWVEKLLKDNYKNKVKHNVVKKKRGISAQFDLTYGLFKTKYVECKYRQENKKIHLDDVATFVAKLKLFNIPTRRALFVTNVEYDKRSEDYLKKIRLNYLDGDELYRMHKKRLGLIKRLRCKNLEDAIINYN